MERAELDRLQEQFGELVRERFPGAPVQRVAMLGYGDDPEIEPGQLEVMAAGEEEAGRQGPRLRLMVKAGPPPGGEGQLVPVMARLGPADLETVDVLITAGIAANRAEAVRWALARIRERPAYAQLQQRAREIEELKTQF